MHGNKQVAKAVSQLFGNTNKSDCTIIFYVTTKVANVKKRRRLANGSAAALHEQSVVGDPLPGHQFILGAASRWFEARLDRWHAGDEADAGAAGSATARTERPLIRVPLSSEEEVPATRAAIAFAYTGEVHAGSIREALEIRRQGAYLQVAGCTTACNQVINGMVTATRQGAGSGGADGGAAVQAALELFDCLELWPEYEEDDSGSGSDDEEELSFASVLASAKMKLVAHFRDALHTLNTPSLRRQMLALPAVGLEALLEPDHFGTDSESTVLLLLATWMETNYHRTDAATRQRLCRHVRLVQLSRPFLSAVVLALALDHETKPRLRVGWCPIRAMTAGLLLNMAGAQVKERTWLEQNNVGLTEYKRDRRRQCVPPSGLTLSWHVTEQQLRQALADLQPGGRRHLYAVFDVEENPRVAARGFGWRVFVKLTHGQAVAGVYLSCEVPAAFKAPGSRLAEQDPVGVVLRTEAKFAVHRWRDGAQQGSATGSFSADSLVSVGESKGFSSLLPLRQQAGAGGGAAADSLAAWADYLHDGRLAGTVTLLQSSG